MIGGDVSECSPSAAACEESAQSLLAMGSLLIALHRRVAPRACAEAGLGVRALLCLAGGNACGLVVRVEALCRFSVRA